MATLAKAVSIEFVLRRVKYVHWEQRKLLF
jgi:hypothetical protein